MLIEESYKDVATKEGGNMRTIDTLYTPLVEE